MATLPYIPGITEQIGRIRSKHNIRTIFKPSTKLGQILRNPKDNRSLLDTVGIHEIPGDFLVLAVISIYRRNWEDNKHTSWTTQHSSRA